MSASNSNDSEPEKYDDTGFPAELAQKTYLFTIIGLIICVVVVALFIL